MPYNVGSDYGLHCLLSGFSIKNDIKVTKIDHPSKMTNRLFENITVEESTSIQWVKFINTNYLIHSSGVIKFFSQPLVQDKWPVKIHLS